MNTIASEEVTVVEPAGGVLVGDDGSDCAAEAVLAAAQESVRRGLALHVVRAWSIMSAVRPPDLPRGVVPSVLELQASTLEEQRRRLAALLADNAGDVGGTVEPEVHVVHAAPAKALLHASGTADLLVVGTRGLGGFKHLLLGSVAEQCIRYAACNVLVVRAGRSR
jgi:nucleotide-binding universal stress UspA family protein